MRTRPWAMAVAAALLLTGCGWFTNPNRQAGPAYSTVPCSDNCGGDAQCISRCQPTTTGPNTPPAAGINPLGH